MTLDEAIKHCEEKAKEQKKKATAIARAKEPFYKYAECAECAKEHEQLASWLKELKALKERPQVVLFADGMTEEEKQKLIAEFKAVMDNTKLMVEPDTPQGDLISRSALKKKLKEHHDFFVNAYGGFKNLPANDKARVDEITNCIAEIVNAPAVKPCDNCDLYFKAMTKEAELDKMPMISKKHKGGAE